MIKAVCDGWQCEEFFVVTSGASLVLYVESPEEASHPSGQPKEGYVRVFARASDAARYCAALRVYAGIDDDLRVVTLSIGRLFEIVDGLNDAYKARFQIPLRVELSIMPTEGEHVRGVDTLWTSHQYRH
jgi:hypothetical protein